MSRSQKYVQRRTVSPGNGRTSYTVDQKPLDIEAALDELFCNVNLHFLRLMRRTYHIDPLLACRVYLHYYRLWRHLLVSPAAVLTHSWPGARTMRAGCRCTRSRTYFSAPRAQSHP